MPKLIAGSPTYDVRPDSRPGHVAGVGTRRVVMGKESWDEWNAQYATSHQHTVNRVCHTIGIPMIAVSLVLAPIGIWRPGWWWGVGALFVVGWLFQFAGHVFERKPPEFLKDWRFLFVGLRWWFAKMAGRA